MIRYIIRRLLWAIVLFLAVTIVTYVIFYLIPVDPARLAAGRKPDAAGSQERRPLAGTDHPIWYQYLHFLKRLVIDHSLGYSFANRQSVNSTIFAAAPVTISLVLGGALLWMTIALPVGVYSALHPRSVGPTASRWRASSWGSRPIRCGSGSCSPTSSASASSSSRSRATAT